VGHRGPDQQKRAGRVTVKEMNVSAEVPDWSRENIRRFWDPASKLMRSIRRYQAARARKGPLAALTRRYWVLNHLFWSTITQSEIHLHCQIAGGLRLPHPTGIIIHPGSTIGPNCMIFHQVTLAGPVTLGGHVDIGAGAKILNGVTIGDHVTIGANAVVTTDVPSGVTVAGVPARIIGGRYDMPDDA
jgi:serine O-acetyltransferase